LLSDIENRINKYKASQKTQPTTVDVNEDS